MNQKKLRLTHFMIIYPGAWLVYYLFELISKNITGFFDITMNLIPIIPLFIASLFFYNHYKKSVFLSIKTTTTWVISLFLLDQISKIIVSLVFSNTKINSFNLIQNYLSITPHINEDGSFIASRFNLNTPFIIFIILNILILTIIVLLYSYRIKNNKFYSLEQTSFILLFSGGLCSLIDKIFWGGSLDFIHIHNLFIADIKDIFVTLGICSFILSNISIEDPIDKNDFIKYVKNLIKIKNQ